MKEATTNAALKLALEALEGCHTSDKPMHHFFNKPKTDKALTAIKEALALTSTQCEVQPEQKPVAFISPGGHIHYDPYLDSVPLYTTPPKHSWVGLTDEEIREINAQVSQIPPINYTTTTYARALEAKLKEKNT